MCTSVRSHCPMDIQTIPNCLLLKQLIGFNLLSHHDPKQFQRFFPLVALLACTDCLRLFFSRTRVTTALSEGGARIITLIIFDSSTS